MRQAAKFAHYGLAAAEEALNDAGFANGNGLDADMTVSFQQSLKTVVDSM